VWRISILAFVERVLRRAVDLWVQPSLEQRQRFQQVFFPDGIAFDGNGFVRTAVTAPAFSYLRRMESGNEGLVDQSSTSELTRWLRQALLTDNHSPSEYRINGVLRNMPEFHAAFGVKPGDAMFLPPGSE
jgi:hypothetical protein